MCAHAVRVALEKIDGVTSVTVSLNEGMAAIEFDPGNEVTVEKVRQVAIDAGFTPKHATIRIAGTAIHREKPALQVAGTDIVYLLVDHPSSRGTTERIHDEFSGKEIVVTGILPEDRGEERPRVLHVKEFALRPETKAGQ